MRRVFRESAQERIRCIGKQLDAILDQFVRNGVQRNAGARKLVQDVLCSSEVLFKAWAQFAVISECIERGKRRGIDRIAPDQLLDIKDITVGLVLGAGAGPQQPLRLCSLCRKRAPALPGETPLIAPISEPGIGDCDLALQRCEPRLFIGIVGLSDFLVEQLVNCGVDATYKKARDACDRVEITSSGSKRLETAKIGFHHLLIDLLREQQRDIDVDAFADQRPDSGQSGRSSRDLDHQVLAIDFPPEATRLVQAALGIVRKIWRYLDADEAIRALPRIEDGTQHVGCVLDVGDRKPLVELADCTVVSRHHPRDRLIVLVGLGNRLFEDGRIGGYPRQSVFIHELLKMPFGDETARKKIEPHRLAVILQLL